MTARMWFASCMWLLMVIGFMARRNKRVHVTAMLLAIGGDLALVLYLEVTRGAVEKALEFNMSLMQQAHIGLSTVVLILYFPLVLLGVQLAQGKRKYINLHRNLAHSTLVLRTLSFLFMFSMWKY